MDTGLEVLADNISRVVDRAAHTWLQQRGISVDAAMLEAEIRRQIQRALSGAITDYCQTWDRGFQDAAQRDFTTAMALAGTEAARAVVSPCLKVSGELRCT